MLKEQRHNRHHLIQPDCAGLQVSSLSMHELPAISNIVCLYLFLGQHAFRSTLSPAGVVFSCNSGGLVNVVIPIDHSWGMVGNCPAALSWQCCSHQKQMVLNDSKYHRARQGCLITFASVGAPSTSRLCRTVRECQVFIDRATLSELHLARKVRYSKMVISEQKKIYQKLVVSFRSGVT